MVERTPREYKIKRLWVRFPLGPGLFFLLPSLSSVSLNGSLEEVQRYRFPNGCLPIQLGVEQALYAQN